jgi:hypothetical protein
MAAQTIFGQGSVSMGKKRLAFWRHFLPYNGWKRKSGVHKRLGLKFNVQIGQITDSVLWNILLQGRQYWSSKRDKDEDRQIDEKWTRSWKIKVLRPQLMSFICRPRDLLSAVCPLPTSLLSLRIRQRLLHSFPNRWISDHLGAWARGREREREREREG